MDYSKTTEEIYRCFTIKQILHTKKLNLLTACHFYGDHEGPQNRMPSWVPDWRRPITTARLVHLSASGRSAAAAQFDLKKEILMLTGVKCATVVNVQPTFIRPHPTGWVSDFPDRLQKCIHFWSLSEPYVAGESIYDVYLRTFYGDEFSHRYHPPLSGFLDYETCRSLLTFHLEHSHSREDKKLVYPPHTSGFASRVISVCGGRSCFTTIEDFIGVAPAETKTGDIICVLLGCDVPLVLRPNGEENFSLIGECYCHGIMEGTALLGPLPENFEQVEKFDPEAGGYYPVFFDRHEGKTQGEDPRLVGHPLPRWRIDTNEDGTDMFVVEENEDGTEKTRTVVDPRMTAEELEKMGTSIVTFNII